MHEPILFKQKVPLHVLFSGFSIFGLEGDEVENMRGNTVLHACGGSAPGIAQAGYTDTWKVFGYYCRLADGFAGSTQDEGGTSCF